MIEKDKIVEVGKEIRANLKPEDTVIDANGLWVMPGIIDAHCHIGITEEKKGMEGDDCNEATKPITPYLRAIDAINPLDPAFHNALQAGINFVFVGSGSSKGVGGQIAFFKKNGRIV